MAPLLEETSADTFLESSFRLVDGGIRYRLKNANAGGDRKVWRYHAHDSYVPSSQRHSTMVATLKKVDETASDWKEKAESAMHKLKELICGSRLPSTGAGARLPGIGKRTR